MASIKSMNFDHLVGQTVGTSRLLKKLDNGAMSVVFVAFQKTLKRQIAVKILPKVLLTPRMAELFQQEAEAAAFLSHPCIIPVYEVGQTDDFLFFTMQLIKGKSLSYYIHKARRHILPSKRMLPVKTSLTIVLKILDALDYANRMGIVHRDIKPRNILIESHSQRPIITDFGVARSYSSSSNDSRILVGTPTYMAPEQIVSSIVDGRADVYATGVMLMEMLCGGLPYPPYDSAVKLLKIKLRLQDRLFSKTPSQVNPAVDGDLNDIVLKALAYNAERRYPTCRDFANDIEAYLQRPRKPNAPAEGKIDGAKHT
ncbi:MAG: serine/threonine protein kinase [Desulfatitalea sp.]|nr:serine/threonine protein kinase [Desulfatitalea sp.]NNK00553.1 serine/threonine protein kinase [Desulfatitalea sp.]